MIAEIFDRRRYCVFTWANKQTDIVPASEYAPHLFLAPDINGAEAFARKAFKKIGYSKTNERVTRGIPRTAFLTNSSQAEMKWFLRAIHKGHLWDYNSLEMIEWDPTSMDTPLYEVSILAIRRIMKN